MTKPDFKQMTRKELKKYILSHPTDDEAIEEFISNHRSPNTVVLPPPSTMSYEKVKEILKEKIPPSQSEKLD
ncbi:MAG: hypothetical protein QNJ42_16945 [Crocosphaera sp.]|nr:hypothetical protein [Crocosphaera sp.]